MIKYQIGIRRRVEGGAVIYSATDRYLETGFVVNAIT